MASDSYRHGPMSGPSSRDRVLEALHSHGGEAAPSTLAEATGIALRTVSDALRKLRSDGLVEGPPKLPRLTPTGRSTAPTLRQQPTGRLEEAVEACFGHTALAAFCRLGADLIVARHLYPERSFHPALFAYGAPRRGKTAAATLLARALGLEAPEAILLAPMLSPGAVVGRRSGRGAFEPAAHLRLPFLCLDEVGECPEDVRKQAQILCHGDREVPVEGELVTIAGTVMATWNPRQRVAIFSDAYWRRAVTINVDEVRVPDLGTRLARAERESAGAGTLDLASLQRKLDQADRRCAAILQRVEEVLLEDGHARFEARTLELAVLGRAGRHGLGADDDLRALAYGVGTDWLMVTETVPGLVEPGWTLPMERLLGELGDAPGLEDLARVAEGHALVRAETERAVVARRQAAVVEDLDLTATRAAFREAVDLAIRKITRVPEPRRPYAAGIRAQLSKLGKQAGEARSAERLGELIELARAPMSAAEELRSSIDREKALAEAERDRAKAEGEQARREARASRAAQKANQRAARDNCANQLKDWRAYRRRLVALRERQRPGRDGMSPAQRLLADGLLEEVDVVEDEEILPPGAQLWGALRGRPVEARVVSVQRRYLVDRAGRRWRPGQLAQWGDPAAVQIFDEHVRAADAQIAQLERQLEMFKAALKRP